jgi:hypothetical protein
MTRCFVFLVPLILCLFVLFPRTASAHQPFFEEQDWGVNAPFQVADPTISTALYGSLSRPGDVDWVEFRGQKGQGVLLSLVIPQIEGQEEFAPTIALVGPGLPANQLPEWVRRPAEGGALIMPPTPGRAPTYYEPFGKRSYWRRQQARITLPADGTYFVAVYSPKGAVGRYTLSVGEKEVRGGDQAYKRKIDRFWTPLPKGGVRES